MDVTIRPIIYGTEDYEKSIDLRNEVFRKPWGLDIRNEDLSSDAKYEMFGAYKDEKMIATIFLTEDDKETARIKSVAIFDEYRGKGLGKYLMNYVEDIALKRGYKKVALMGRVSAEIFYNKLGYETISEVYDHNTIPHVDMIKEF
ncbi:GNAT family N-acetyltransferase [Tissierella sp. Yu-01]|jgi:predicted GNAT family N-acyltransferase|uniref:GNAT family N-acetyltransferase n=1 Tax=Tissierella sp. Yu-01 TaxID=3035694 RepID=UPI00240D86FB|nr:GNAT family N-acetyltransferase [Tissierella sp. Yu-01]WFA07759.1 GNAT family N-acetyltransferase [Tissierella sp. Yu-01]